MTRVDVIIPLSLILLICVTSLAYLVRALLHGRLKYARVEAHGGSILLWKSVMEMAYWGLNPISHLFIMLRITPNMLTWSAFFLGLAAGVFLGFGWFGFALLFMLFSAAFDVLDGVVARRSGVVSPAGKFLDSTLDRYVEFFLLAGTAYFFRTSLLTVFAVIFAMFGSFMVSYSTALSEILHTPLGKGGMRRPERIVYLLLGTLLTPVVAIALPTSTLGLPLVSAIVVIAILSNLSAGLRLIKLNTQLQRPLVNNKAGDSGSGGILLVPDPGIRGPDIKEKVRASPHSPA